MIHLLIATPSYSLHGGVERIIESLARGLPAHGFRVTVGLAAGSRWHMPDRFRQEYPDLQTTEIDGTSGTRTGRLRGLRKTLHRTRPDIVLIARLFDAYEVVCERKIHGEPIRLAVTIQACEAEYVADLATYGAFVDCCITSGELTAAAVRHFTGVPVARITNIPGGVRPAFRIVDRNPRSPIRVGYVGRLEQNQKRILDLVETLVFLRDFQVPFTCRVAGAGSTRDRLHTELQVRGLAPFVTLEGWKTPDELYADVYPNLDVLLHFAEWEGITIAPREAMAHGVVPVVSRFLGLRAEGHFRHGENALTFGFGDVAEAAQHVRRLYDDLDLWRRLSCEARRSEEGVWSEKGALAAWAEALRRSVERPVARSGDVPLLPLPASGRLGYWLGETWANRLRTLAGRVPAAACPGDEWPHCSGLTNSARLVDIQHFAHAVDSASRPNVATGSLT